MGSLLDRQNHPTIYFPSHESYAKSEPFPTNGLVDGRCLDDGVRLTQEDEKPISLRLQHLPQILALPLK